MKRSYLLILIICLFFITGCKCRNNNVIKFYQEEKEWNEYLEQFYNVINTEGENYVAFDLRSKEQYETKHLRQFQNYDLLVGKKDEFISHLKNNYSKKYSIYIYIESLDDLNFFDDLLDTYKNVYIYIGDYVTYQTLGEELFTFDSGPYDCNC